MILKPGEDQFGLCPRCGKKFIPDWYEALGTFSRCCSTCSFRNLFDAMEDPKMYEFAGISRDEHSIPIDHVRKDDDDGPEEEAAQS